MKKEELIKSLIKDTLVHNKLVMGLNQTGLEADKYHLQLSNTILKLEKITLNNEELDHYFSLLDTLSAIDVENPQQLEKSYQTIYNYLQALKKQKSKQ